MGKLFLCHFLLTSSYFEAAPPARATVPMFFGQNKMPPCTNNIAFVQQTTAGGTSTTTLTFPAITVTAGSLLVIMVAMRKDLVFTISGITDNNLGTGSWVEATGFPATNISRYDIWYSLNHQGGSTTITANIPASADGVAGNLSEFSGVATSNAVDTQATKSTANSNELSGTVTTTNGCDLIIGGASTSSNTFDTGLIDYGASGGTPTGLTSSTSSGTGTKTVHRDGAYQIVTGTGNYGFQWTDSTSNQGGIIAFKSQ